MEMKKKTIFYFFFILFGIIYLQDFKKYIIEYIFAKENIA